MDTAPSVFAKINCLIEAYNNINNNFKFSSGNNKEAGADELTPIFQYIVIKSHPKRVFSNINYIKCFLNMSKAGNSAFLLGQLESAMAFILNIQPQQLKMSKKEFDQNMNQARIILEEKKKIKELIKG